MKNESDNTADVRLERIVSLRPCPFCGGKCDPQGWYDGHGVRGPECETCGATAYSELEWNRRAADKYERANPLGGPAKIFESVASRVRAGEPLDDVMLDYGLRWTDKAG